MAELDDNRALGHGGARSDKNGDRGPRENQLAHEISLPICTETGSFGVPVFSSGSKPLFEQLDLSRIRKAWHQPK